MFDGPSNWAAVQALAAALLEKTFIKAKDVKLIIEDAKEEWGKEQRRPGGCSHLGKGGLCGREASVWTKADLVPGWLCADHSQDVASAPPQTAED